MHIKSELNQMNHLNISILLTNLTLKAVNVKDSFLYSCKRIINPRLAQIHTMRGTVTYDMHTKFMLYGMNHLDTTVFKLEVKFGTFI